LKAVVNSSNDELQDIERRLKDARERLERTPLPFGATSDEWQTNHVASQEVLRLERLAAAAKGEEYAETIEFPVRWNVGAPLPHLFVNDDRALLAFLIEEPDPNWDGSYATIKSAASAEPEPLGLVEFHHCTSAKLGSPNDEVFCGHPLEGKGLEAYRAQRVVNSRWIVEIERLNSVHPRYDPESWRTLRHFIFWFHDSMFECLAESFKVEVYRMPMRELLHQMVERLIA
jgi:hypothetical protein